MSLYNVVLDFYQAAKPVGRVSITCTVKLVLAAEVRWFSQLISYKDSQKELQ